MFIKQVSIELLKYKKYKLQIQKKQKKYLPPEQEYPLGQQCTPSEQQTAFGKGQHP